MGISVGNNLTSNFISLNGFSDGSAGSVDESAGLQGIDTSTNSFESGQARDYSGLSNNRWQASPQMDNQGRPQLPWAQPKRGNISAGQEIAEMPELQLGNDSLNANVPSSGTNVDTGLYTDIGQTSQSSYYSSQTSTTTNAPTLTSQQAFIPVSEMPDWCQNPATFTPPTTPTTTTTPTTPTTPTTTSDPSTSASAVAVNAAAAQALGLTNSTNPDVQAALNTMQPVLSGTSSSSNGAIAGANIVEDPNDINGSTSTQSSQAAALVSANTALVASVIPAADLANYNAVQSSLSSDPVAQLSLQKMALTGDLFNTTTDPTTGATLDTLGQLANIANGTTQLASTVDPTSFLAQTVKEAATPSAANQEQTEDCALDACTTLTDRLTSAEFVRVTAQAASPSGTVTWQNGTSDTRSGAATDNGSGVALPLQFLNNVEAVAAGTDPTSGTSPTGIATLVGKMFNTTVTPAEVDLTSDATISSSQASMMATITSSTSNNAPVLAGIVDQQGDGHEVLVNGIVGGMVEYTNSWGDEETASVADFQANLCTVIAPGEQVAQQASTAQIYAGVSISA